MPAGDGTGPDGTGGWCTPLWMSGQIPRSLGPGFRRPYGQGFRGRRAPGTGGRGRGRMNMFYATGLPGWARFGLSSTPAQPPSKNQEMEWLENEAKALEQELNGVRQRIKELKEE
jgi:hypothetical protein